MLLLYYYSFLIRNHRIVKNKNIIRRMDAMQNESAKLKRRLNDMTESLTIAGSQNTDENNDSPNLSVARINRCMTKHDHQ